MKPFQEDRDLGELLRRLPRFRPRSGYEERFWARAEAYQENTPRFRARWLPAAAAGLGIAMGIFMGIALNHGSLQEIKWSGGLPSGSLAATVINYSGR